MIIREGTEKDIIPVSYLWLEMVNEMKPEWKPNDMWWREIAAMNFSAGRYFFHVVDSGESLVGFLDWFLFPEPSDGMVHAIGQHQFLKKEYRGKGIGAELYRHTIEQTKAKGVKVCDLMCLEDEKMFWEKRGYAPLRTLMRLEGQYV